MTFKPMYGKMMLERHKMKRKIAIHALICNVAIRWLILIVFGSID